LLEIQVEDVDLNDLTRTAIAVAGNFDSTVSSNGPEEENEEM